MNCFKNTNLSKEFADIVIDCIYVLNNTKTSIEQKQAANILLKIFLKNKFRRFLLNDSSLYPISRKDTRVTKWSNEVKSVGYCQKCGTKRNLEAHHIIKWSDFPKGRIDVNNGICLCLDCHIKEHKEDKSYYLMRGKKQCVN